MAKVKAFKLAGHLELHCTAQAGSGISLAHLAGRGWFTLISRTSSKAAGADRPLK
jgi:hypothetical protein